MGIEVEKRDISVAGRLLAHFSKRLAPEQRVKDELAALGELAKTPNISASVPKRVECIAELQAKGYNVPDYPANRKNSEDKGIKVTYAKVLKEDRRLQKGEVINATKLSTAKLCVFFETEMADCSEEKLMMLLHMKPTKMRVSDPFILTAELFKTLTAELFKTLMRIVTGQVCFKEVSNSGGFVCQVPVCPGRIVTEVLSARGGSFTKVLSARPGRIITKVLCARGGLLPRSRVPGEDRQPGSCLPGEDCLRLQGSPQDPHRL